MPSAYTGQPSPGYAVPTGMAISPGGAQGLQGGPAVRGTQWWNGAGPPTPPPTGSITGDYYLDTTSGDVWVL